MNAMNLKVLAPVAALGLSACFASQADVRVLQSDMMLIRNEAASADSARRAQLDDVARTMTRMESQLSRLNDSLVAVNGRLVRFRSDMAASMNSVEQQLLQIQELTGQGQRKIQEMRSTLESREISVVDPVQSPAKGGSTTPARPGEDKGPGPNELYNIAQQQLNQGSYESARTAFQDLLNRYPTSDVAVDAQYYIGDSYAAEGNTKSADSAYAIVVAKYPKSPRAPAALYKRAIAAATAGKTSEARKLYNEVIKKYGRSDEATLAKERLELLDQKD